MTIATGIGLSSAVPVVGSTTVLSSLVGYADGALISTATPPALWRLARGYVQIVATPRLAVSAAGGGAWIRDVASGAPGASNVAAWYVNTATGNDDNDGLTALTSLASIQEFLYRLGSQPIDGYVVGIAYVYVAGDTAAPLTIDVKFSNDGGLAFVGTKTNLLTGQTISAVTAWNTTTGVVGSYTLTGAPVLTSHVGHFVRINAGARLGFKAPIAKAISAGVFRASWADQNDGSAIEPVVADTLDVYRVNAIAADIRIAGGPAGTAGGTIYFQDLDLGTPGSDHSVVVSSGQVSFVACVVHGLDFYEGVTSATLSLCYVVECRSYGFAEAMACTFASVGGSALAARGRGIFRVSSRCLIQGGGLTAGHALEGPGHLRCSAPAACVDYPSSALLVFPGATAVLDDVLTARDAASAPLAVQVMAGGGVFYASGKAPVIVGTAPTGDYKVGGTAKAKAAIPYFETTNGAAVVVNQ